jgi:hypothetical protein
MELRVLSIKVRFLQTGKERKQTELHCIGLKLGAVILSLGSFKTGGYLNRYINRYKNK